MPRTFALCRVSTLGQTVENQIHEIEAAGFHVEKRRLVTETVSGSSAIEQRPGFRPGWIGGASLMRSLGVAAVLAPLARRPRWRRARCLTGQDARCAEPRGHAGDNWHYDLASEGEEPDGSASTGIHART